ncbi:SH3 domain-containing protein [Halobacillus kuroshimensis]|uniref:SH3 domain-containing protein n=1 Tax=Halobacillus kuroshimensis TaxID=302481 RepID=A0ABS3DZI0_9BACI|nr:SH3 domain-containing protein [Halobacillus kuroshimensis]MBN8236740.1 SH3 domain-containing protein [Halobacillus kuroshimensis]
MKKGLFLIVFLLAAFSMLEAESRTVHADQAVIQVDYLNVRTGPDTSYNRIGQVHANETYIIVKEQNNWLKIKWNGKTGWVAKWLTTVKKETSQASGTYYSKYDYLRIRSSAGLDGKIKGYLMKNDVVTPQKSSGKWVYIQHGSIKGWVHGDYLAKKKSSTSSSGSSSSNESSGSQSVIGKIEVDTPVLNVRSQNSTKGTILTQIKKGEVYEYINEKDRWYQIKWGNGRTGWVAGWLVDPVSGNSSSGTTTANAAVTLDYNYTNIRSGPSTGYKVVGQAHKGDQFDVIAEEGRWYKIKFNGSTAYVAGWIVTETTKGAQHTNYSSGSLKGKTIMLDPGHGGRDSGAVGRAGSYESDLTLSTALILKKQLEQAGADVLMTRSSNEYVALSARTYYSNASSADAFISLHYNSAPLYISATGLNTYYYHSRDKNLASALQTGMVQKTGLRDRGIKYGNFHVIRENQKPSALLELGFISDAREEQTVRTSSYQQKVSQGVVQGLIQYFK